METVAELVEATVFFAHNAMQMCHGASQQKNNNQKNNSHTFCRASTFRNPSSEFTKKIVYLYVLFSAKCQRNMLK